jgi:hypothetical protein
MDGSVRSESSESMAASLAGACSRCPLPELARAAPGRSSPTPPTPAPPFAKARPRRLCPELARAIPGRRGASSWRKTGRTACRSDGRRHRHRVVLAVVLHRVALAVVLHRVVRQTQRDAGRCDAGSSMEAEPRISSGRAPWISRVAWISSSLRSPSRACAGCLSPWRRRLGLHLFRL